METAVTETNLFSIVFRITTVLKHEDFKTRRFLNNFKWKLHTVTVLAKGFVYVCSCLYMSMSQYTSMVYDKSLIPVILNLPLLKSFSFNNFAIKYNATFKIEFPYQDIVENSDVIRRIFFHRHLIDTKFAENKNNNYLVWDSEQTKQDHNS